MSELLSAKPPRKFASLSMAANGTEFRQSTGQSPWSPSADGETPFPAPAGAIALKELGKGVN